MGLGCGHRELKGCEVARVSRGTSGAVTDFGIGGVNISNIGI